MKEKIPMKCRLGAKITALILLPVLLALTVGACLAGAAMVINGFYEMPMEEYREKAFTDLAESVADTALNMARYDAPYNLENYLSRQNVTAVTIEGTDGLHGTWGQPEQGKAYRVYYQYGYFEETDGDGEKTPFQYPLKSAVPGKTPAYDESHSLATIDVYVDMELPQRDNFYFRDLLIQIGYALRYWIFPIALLALVGSVWCLVFLIRSAGCTKEGWKPWVTVKIPWDLWYPIAALAAFLGLEVILKGVWYHYGKTIYLVLGTPVMFCYVLFLLMEISVRIRAGHFFTPSIFLLLGKKIWHIFGIITRYVKEIFDYLPLLWKTLLIYGAISIINLTGNLIWGWDEGTCTGFWIAENVILLPVVLSCALMMRRLLKAGEAMAQGDMDCKVDTSRMLLDFKRHGENLNHIGEGMTVAVEERMKSERMKTALITNVSHDIKTPLTSIINYSDLICSGNCDGNQITQYAQVLHRQSEKLKRLIEDLVEASKASTGNMEINLVPCEVGVILTQAVGEYEEKLQAANLELITKKPNTPVTIMADSRRLWRIFDNLMINISKYAQPGTRVYLTLEEEDGNARISFKNISRAVLDISPDELMERFVRGDSSRNSDGNGLGLSITKSLTELQGGTMNVSIDGDLFKVVLSFPKKDV